MMRKHRARELMANHGDQARDEAARRKAYLIKQLFPDTGVLRRERYAKHMEYFAAGATERERLMLAANRVGKTQTVGAFETALHMTGLYDRYAPWWTGRRFDRPISCWAAGDTSKTVRDIIQPTLIGPTRLLRPTNDDGSAFEEVYFDHGVIPPHLITHKTPKQGVAEAIETIYVRHVSGGTSSLQLKSYDQKREAFQGTSQDLIWLDEEPPLDIYTECLLRTMTTGGIIMLTFTPLMGMTDLIQSFFPDSTDGERPHDGEKVS